MSIDLEAIAKAIEADAGEPIPGLRESLAEMAADERARTHTPEQIALREARAVLGLSQPAFARLIDTPVGTVRDWEQGRFPPPGSAFVEDCSRCRDCKTIITNNTPLPSLTRRSEST
jgi:putative transcriptional regulator